MSFTNINNCDFYTNKICKGRLRKIYEDDILETNKNIVTIGMFLCQTHYNQLILSESLRIKKLKLNEFAKICSMCRKRNDKDLKYLQNEEYKVSIFRKIDNNILEIRNYTY